MIRYALLIAIVALLLGLFLLGVGPARSDSPDQLTGYRVEWGTASGGGYHLISTAWQVQGVAGGGEYHLAGPLILAGTGTPCCCTYLPCVQRRFP